MKQLIVNNLRKAMELLIIEDGKMSEYYKLDLENENSIEGNIYVGKVKNIVQGMQTFFIDIGKEKNGFLFANDLKERIEGEKINKNIEKEKISKLLKKDNNVLVQVKKDEIDNKGVRLTTDISLVGRYFILTPHSHFLTITKKIVDDSIREEYIRIVKEFLPKEYGGIIRTNILEASDDEIKNEIEQLVFKWEKIKKETLNISKYENPTLIYENSGILDTTIKDILNKDLIDIVVNNRKTEKYIKDKAKLIGEKYAQQVKYVKTSDILKEYDLREKLNKLFEKRVWLKCGGYLIISKTEALTAIDVNTGKFTGTKDLESTIFKVNKEAAVEIAKQMRLRNMGGIVIVDFIDMKNVDNKNEILNILQDEVKKDRSKVNVKGYTSLNLMEITRKKKNI